jgi:hypothetical protein
MSKNLERIDKAAPVHKTKCNSYALDGGIDIIKCKQSGEQVIDTVCALSMPETITHTVLKNAKDYEAKATTTLRYSE